MLGGILSTTLPARFAGSSASTSSRKRLVGVGSDAMRLAGGVTSCRYEVISDRTAAAMKHRSVAAPR
jgi:hypothetical protein